MKKIVNNLLGVLFTIITLLFVLLGMMNYSSSPDGPSLFGYKGYVVTSNSMQPVFSAGDYIVVKVEDYSEIEKNDVITFLDEGTIVTHRIVSKLDGGFETKGDANNVNDMTLVEEKDYIGTMKQTFAKLGTFIIFIQRPIVFPVLLFIVGIYILYLYYTGNDDEEN